MMTTNTFGLVGRSKDKITEAALRINFKISIQLKQKAHLYIFQEMNICTELPTRDSFLSK